MSYYGRFFPFKGSISPVVTTAAEDLASAMAGNEGIFTKQNASIQFLKFFKKIKYRPLYVFQRITYGPRLLGDVPSPWTPQVKVSGTWTPQAKAIGTWTKVAKPTGETGGAE